ncbi:MAG: nitroreductase family protein [Planctomycetota bacterium]|nr:nitroreductase family protein [Planctomycetota bacterium]
MHLPAFLDLVRARRATRRFRAERLPGGVLDELLDAARWAPSGYNLQPTRFVLVKDAAAKTRLRRACMGQPQITEAPVTVVLCGDTQVVARNFDDVLRQDKEAGALSDEYEGMLRKFVPLAFATAPLGLGWLAKAFLLPVVGLFTPIPEFPAVHRRRWLAKQVSLSAMNLMLAATAAGLATCPMEGFSERFVRKAVSLPRGLVPLIVVPLGYAADPPGSKTRLPLARLVSGA